MTILSNQFTCSSVTISFKDGSSETLSIAAERTAIAAIAVKRINAFET